MSLEVVAISALCVAVLGAIATCVSKIGMKKCHAGCIESDCMEQTNIDMEKELCRLHEKIEKNKAKIQTIKDKRRSEPTTPVLEKISESLETMV